MWSEYRGKTSSLIAFFLALYVAASTSTTETLVAEKGTENGDVAREGVAEVEEPDVTIEPDVSTEVSGEIEFAAPTISTLSGVEAARWSPNVTITLTASEFRFESNGIPDHELPEAFSTQDRGGRGLSNVPEFRLVDIRASLGESSIDQTITLNPVLADAPSTAPVGRIGVLINGAQLYNELNQFSSNSLGPRDGRGFVDSCNGQPVGGASNDQGSDYHYHAVPRCTTDSIDIEGQHSSILGVLIDGFPVYGSNDEGGEAIARRNLDACSGHFGPTPEFPDGIYHYHLLDRVSAVPISCLSGEIGDAVLVDDSTSGVGDSPESFERDENEPGARVRDEVNLLGE